VAIKDVKNQYGCPLAAIGTSPAGAARRPSRSGYEISLGEESDAANACLEF